MSKEKFFICFCTY